MLVDAMWRDCDGTVTHDILMEEMGNPTVGD